MTSDDTITGTLYDSWDAMSVEDLCHHCRPVLRNIIEARLGDHIRQRVDASDVVQETLLEVHRRIVKFKAQKPMPIWIWLRRTAIQQLKIAIRLHQNSQRRTILRQISCDRSSVFQLVEYFSAIPSTSQEHLENIERAERTQKALMQLPSLDREVLMLRYLNGLTNQQIADLLGVTASVASKRHCRALGRLQKLLEN